MRIALCLIILIFECIATQAYALTSFDEVKRAYMQSDAVLLDRNGAVLHEIRIDPKNRRLNWVELNNISPSLLKAVLRSEDRKFRQHRGVDWTAMVAATATNLFSRKQRGASTITMQLVPIIDKTLKRGNSKRTINQKLLQMQAALEIEKTWTKDAILEAYLNMVSFRGELQGIAAASRGLFDKDPNGLTNEESLILASLIRSPNAPIGDVTIRACALSDAIAERVSCDAISKLATDRLIGPYPVKPRTAIAPHVARNLIKKQSTRVNSTLDSRLQRFALETLNYQINTLARQNVHDGAVIVVENKTGRILAYVGNTGRSSSAPHVDGVEAPRQAGSTLKPFLYEYAIEQGLLTPSSILDDAPVTIPTTAGLYIPHNYDDDFKGPVSVRTALSASLNVPAVKTLSLVGTAPFAERLGKLGFQDIKDGEYHGLSLALGSAEVSLIELVNAYRTLANGGIWSELTFMPNSEPARRVRIIPEAPVYIMTDILSDREARSTTFGFENPLSTRFASAVKTGTSKDMKDNWCIGFTSRYTVGVWVGNFSGEPMWNVSGVTGAAPVWLEIMNYLHRSVPAAPHRRPEGVEMATIRFEDGIEPERNEWFIKGTMPVSGGESIMLNTGQSPASITYPAKGTVIAIDPDIPVGQQAVLFEATTAEPDYTWFLNNRPLGTATGPVLWQPNPGRYVVALRDKNGRTIDAVDFEVR